MSNVTKFFLVPIGLPGMGKSTLSRFLSATSQQYFNERFNQNIQMKSYPKIQSFSKRTGFGQEASQDKNGKHPNVMKPIKIEF